MKEKLLRHVGIGYGVMGGRDTELIEETGRAVIVAISDEDDKNLKRAAERFPEARLYTDWREMLSCESDGIDSVSISTRDHIHAPAAMAAIRAGKHVFCQKPLTHQILEARRLTQAAREAGVVTQMGIQIHSHETYRTAVATIKHGAIGKVREVHAWSSDSSVHPAMLEPSNEEAPPAGLHWDNWLGVAPARAFKPLYLFTWHGWMDLGNGVLGNVGCHVFDPIVSALNLGSPASITAQVPEDWSRTPAEIQQTWPAWEVIRWEFDPTPYTVNEPISLTWYDGGKMPPTDLFGGEPIPSNGSILIGERGRMLLPHFKMPILLPHEAFSAVDLQVQLPVDHYKEYVDACLDGNEASCGFDYSGPLTETVLLGMLAVRFAPQPLAWDGVAGCVSNHKQANRFLMSRYREDWEVPGLTTLTNDD